MKQKVRFHRIHMPRQFRQARVNYLWETIKVQKNPGLTICYSLFNISQPAIFPRGRIRTYDLVKATEYGMGESQSIAINLIHQTLIYRIVMQFFL